MALMALDYLTVEKLRAAAKNMKITISKKMIGHN